MFSVLLRTSAGTVVLLTLVACSTPDNPTGPRLLASGATVVPTARAPLVYRSAFDGYQPDRELEAANWKQANDTVHAIGGWRSYARESAPPAGATR